MIFFFKNITIRTRYFSKPWWGNAEPIYITSVSSSETRKWEGKIENIYFRDIKCVSEGGVVIFGNTSMISRLVFMNVSVTVSQWYSNYANPCHDWRPSEPPEMVPSPIDGFYVDGAAGYLINSNVEFSGKKESYWRDCVFKKNSVEFKVFSLKCNK